MKILSDYHSHTIYSSLGHGKGTIEENVQAARKKGLREVWITDHGPGHLFFGIKRRYLGQVRKEIDRLNSKYEDIDIYFGLEANIIGYDGKIDVGKRELAYLDGLNLGFHSGVKPSGLKSFLLLSILNPLARLIRPMRPWVRRKNTEAMIAAVENNDIQLITHPSDKFDLDLKRLALVCEKEATALEINSSHDHLSEEELRLLRDTKVKFGLGSDAHRPERIGDFTRALDRIARAGIDSDRIINLKEI